jgi:hypothetical protein
MRSDLFSAVWNATWNDGINSSDLAPGARSCVMDVETKIHFTSLISGDAGVAPHFAPSPAFVRLVRNSKPQY